MLKDLTEKLGKSFKKLSGYGKITESNISEALKDVRLNLLEADVNYKVVKDLIEEVKSKAIGAKVHESLTPGQQIIQIFKDELVAFLGGELSDLNVKVAPPAVIMVVGLQGSGKTSTCAKIAVKLKKEGRNPYLVPCDTYRPAAVDQLTKLANDNEISVYEPGSTLGRKDGPVRIASKALKHAKNSAYDTVIIDTAGRLHIDQEMMKEVKEIKEKTSPHEILFVADSMTGQDAVNVAKEFNSLLDVTGFVLTKMDGDARGGAALSIYKTTGKPLKLLGIGEKVEDLEPFHPDRLVSRILGMGDVMSLIEKTQENFDEQEALKLQENIKKNSFTINDFLSQLKMMKKMGSMESLMGMIPGMNKMVPKDTDFSKAEKEFKRMEAIINSMTKFERENHAILNGSRRKRIALGSGTRVQDVNSFIKQFRTMQKFLKRFNQSGMKQIGKLLGNKFM
jgi:signal recognition particle subunit SRP54